MSVLMVVRQWFQLESALHQNWMRDYDPTPGRYLQADPLGLVDGASVYGYALQNPGRYVDPSGEQAGVFDQSGGISLPSGRTSTGTGGGILSGIRGGVSGGIGGAISLIVTATPAGVGGDAPASLNEIARTNGSCGDPCEEAKNSLRAAKKDAKRLGGKLSCTTRSGRLRTGLSASDIRARIDILQREVQARASALMHCKDETGKDHPGELAAKQRALVNCWKNL